MRTKTVHPSRHEHDTRSRRRRRAGGAVTALALIGSLGAAAVSTGEAQAAECNGRWQKAAVQPDEDFLQYRLKAIDAKHVWSVGRSKTKPGSDAALFNGSTWRIYDVPGIEVGLNFTATGPDNAYMVGGNADAVDETSPWDALAHFNGTTWSKVPFPTVWSSDSTIMSISSERKNSLWVSGWKFGPNGQVPLFAHYDGTAWKSVASNVAGAAQSVPLAAGFSPSGELWVTGEDIDQAGYTQWAGKLVNGQIRRVELPQIPDVSQEVQAAAIDWTAAGDPVIGGHATRADASLTSFATYAYTTIKRNGQWTLQAQHSPVAGDSGVWDLTRIGSKLWSAGGSRVQDDAWTDVATLEGDRWSPPKDLEALRGTRSPSMTGLPDGRGWMTNWNLSWDDPDTTLWTICGTPPATATADEPASVTPPAAAPKAATDTPRSIPTVKARKALLAEQRKARSTGHRVIVDGITPLPGKAANAGRSANRPVNGPAVDQLRQAQRSAATTPYVAKPLCAPTDSRAFRCLASVVSTQTSTKGLAGPIDGPPAGYGPKEFRAAYNLPATGGKGRTVAVVAYGAYEGLENDLATYRAATGLPECTTKSGCLRIIGQDGGAPPPNSDEGWSLEQALDVQAVSATCPDCKILVVQASALGDSSFATANRQAATQGAFVINNSFGREEASVDVDIAESFVPQGVPVVAATGDIGHATSFPSTVPRVIGAGGTRLLESPGTARGWREDAWKLGGGGCSAVQPKPAWEKDPLCLHGKASAVDVSAAGDPGTGAAVYFAQGLGGEVGGWYVVGGTSLSAPLTAGMLALRGGKVSAESIWNRSTPTQDVAGGVTTGWCAPARECKAVSGYDGATGWGSLKRVG